MKRRDFIAGLGAAAWPLAARAQSFKIPVIGFLSPASALQVAKFNFWSDFYQGLKDQGYLEGQNLAITPRTKAIGFQRLLPTSRGATLR
jgi:hypothetical protein